MNTDTHEQEFYLKIAYTLGSCQMLEQELKNYIKTSHGIIREKVEEFIPYRFDEDDLEKYALGKLVEVFSKMSNDIDVIKRLKEFVSLRNELAHSAIAKSRDYEDGLFYPKSMATMQKLTQVNNEASSLRTAVYGACNRIYCMHAFNNIDQ